MQLNHHREGHGEPLLLIHGIGSRWQMWQPVMGALTARHDVIAIDLPGFGASGMPPEGTRAGPESLTDLVEGFLSDLGVERPHVVGNSLGGLVALDLAARGEARSATVLSPAGFASQREQLTARASLWVMVRTARALAPRADRLLRPTWARRAAFAQVVAHGENFSPEEGAATLRALAQAPWFDATLPTLKANHFDGRPIDVPVTVAWGERDHLLPRRQLERARRLIPGARVVLLRNCGHVCTYDDPAQVARVVLETTAAAA